MTIKTNPIRPTDPDARTLARDLIKQAKFGALGVLTPDTGAPHVTRIAIGQHPTSGQPITLISDLSFHTKALHKNPSCSVLLGEPASKGDPLTHPRISLQCHAELLTRDSSDYNAIRDHYLATHPKSKLYIDFADFNFVIFNITSADLNAGFGKAYALTANDLN
ncbi:MAG: pyridoxamine 5-phosphate oxidase [Rhodobacteraceae bacterium]|nr:MAG: pyridoxamine 5-phosphate oxidase [Paracoccaceae bacterium]